MEKKDSPKELKKLLYKGSKQLVRSKRKCKVKNQWLDFPLPLAVSLVTICRPRPFKDFLNDKTLGQPWGKLFFVGQRLNTGEIQTSSSTIQSLIKIIQHI